MDYMKLQNGSDVRGTAIAVPGGRPVDLTEESVNAIGGAFVAWLRDKKKLDRTARVRIATGRDSRLSGKELGSWFSSGARAAGADVTDFGLATTPAMFMATVTGGYMFDGTAMITASHLPFERNGFKFFTSLGGLEKADIADILSRASAKRYETGMKGNGTEADFMSVYSGILRDKIARGEDRPLAGLHIIVDAGNGAGGFFARDVLAPLGADISGSRFLEPDGRFPNHAPNPENAEAMASVTEATVKSRADLGIIFDTDVDRAGAVLQDGRELNRNLLIAMIAAIELRDHPGATVVTDSITSTGLADFIAAKGGVHRRFKRGYRNVINEAMRLNGEGIDAELAMETSGHGALKENYFLDDGAYLMVKLITELARAKKEGKPLSHLIDGLAEPAESREYRMPLLTDDFAPYGKRVIAELAVWAAAEPGFSIAKDNFEGVRVNCDRLRGDGWFLLRMSLHEPLMPLNIESDNAGGVGIMAGALGEFLKRFDMLDSSALLASAKAE